MLAFVSSASLLGVEGHRVTVEVHASSGLPSYTIVGLPDASCRESRDRVRAALLSSDQQWPQCRLTVNLAPTGLPKAGAGLDLAIAIGILAATDKLPSERLVDHAFIGELGLDGSIRAVPGRCRSSVPSIARRSWCRCSASMRRGRSLSGPRRADIARRDRRTHRPGAVAGAAGTRTGRRGSRASRSARGAGSAARAQGARGRRGRGPPSVDGRAAGGGQDDARSAAPGCSSRLGSGQSISVASTRPRVCPCPTAVS